MCGCWIFTFHLRFNPLILSYSKSIFWWLTNSPFEDWIPIRPNVCHTFRPCGWLSHHFENSWLLVKSGMIISDYIYKSILYHIYNYYHNHIYIISISYPINVMLKIPLWMVCKCPFSQLNPPKIQLCPGQIWGGRGPALFFRVAIGDIFIQQICLGSKNWNSMVWFTQENDYHAFYPGLYNLYIIVNMDAMKYRRTRGFTHLDDMGMHGLHLVCQAMPSFQNLQHIGKDRIIREVISHKFCRMNRLFFGIRPTRVPSLSNTQIVRVWYVCWGWKGLRSCHLP